MVVLSSLLRLLGIKVGELFGLKNKSELLTSSGGQYQPPAQPGEECHQSHLELHHVDR